LPRLAAGRTASSKLSGERRNRPMRTAGFQHGRTVPSDSWISSISARRSRRAASSVPSFRRSVGVAALPAPCRAVRLDPRDGRETPRANPRRQGYRKGCGAGGRRAASDDRA
jgi:hypothetical protein